MILVLSEKKIVNRYIILILIFLISIKLYSQKNILERSISVDFTELAIHNIIDSISLSEGVNFSYRSDLEGINKKVDIHKKNTKIKKILKTLFSGTDIRYVTVGNQIVLLSSKNTIKDIYIQGLIFDSISQVPIPYATVVSQISGEGVIADFESNFEYQTNELFLNDTLKMSSLGYSQKKISLKSLYKQESIKIYLVKHPNLIEQVDVNANNFLYEKTGNRRPFAIGSLYMDTHGQQTALFIENKRKKNGKILSLSYRLSPKGNTDAPFRIRVYSKDTLTGSPKDDLLKDMLIVKPEIKRGWFTIDISSYEIIAPPEGFFVAMEGVFPNDYDYYFKQNSYGELSSKTEKRRIKHLSITYGQRLSYNRKFKNHTWHYSLSHKWFQLDKNKYNIMISSEIQYKKD